MATDSPRPVIDLPSDPREPAAAGSQMLLLGRRIRHARTERGLTLDELGQLVGSTASQLSLVENGRREPRLSLLQSLAAALGTTTTDLLDAAPPSRRAALEIDLDRAQGTATYAALGLPTVRPAKNLSTEALEALVGLHRELARRDDAAIATPEEARRATTALRLWMRERNNHLPEIETAAEDLVRRAGYTTGALTHSAVASMAADLGFTLIHVDDLPHSTRTVTDLANGRIYLPPASIPGGHGLRSLALQAIAHRVLAHSTPRSYADFLRQRVEITYFAAACLMPRTAAVAHLSAAKRRKELAVEDFRDSFGVTHEAAAQRLTNLLTEHLDIRLHFLRVGDDGTLFKGYSNDAVRFPTDGTGAIEGQVVCREWAARSAFTRRDRATRVLPVHRHARGHVLVHHADGLDVGGRVLDHRGGPVRRREVVPRTGHVEASRVPLPRPDLLPAARPRAGRAVGAARVAERRGARARALAAAHRRVPRRRRCRGVRVSRPPRTAVMVHSGAMPQIRVFLLDDHEVVRQGLLRLLESTADITVVGEAATAQEALVRIPRSEADVALLDVRLPDGSGIEVCRELASTAPGVRCLMLTSYEDDEALLAAITAGAAGYVLKEIRGSQLLDSIRLVAGGRSLLDPATTRARARAACARRHQRDPRLDLLTTQESAVLDLIGEGLSNREIAERMFLAEKTVKNYISSLLAKIEVRGRTQAALFITEQNRLHPE